MTGPPTPPTSRPWIFPLRLDDDGDHAEPRFLRIARAIADDVRRGRLRAGDILPGSRTLAGIVGVHRNTVLAAMAELAAQGWIETSGRVTRVARDLAAAPAPARELGFTLRPGRARRDLGDRPLPRGALVFCGGLPDPRLFPVDDLARAWRRALRAPGRKALEYGDPRGDASLRQALATMLRETRGLATGEENLLLTRGSQGALDLVGRRLFGPGDVVAVEEPGYRPAWDALVAGGATLVSVPVDGEGVRVDKLAALAESRRLAGVYVTPHHQFPTTVTLSAARRLKLLALARRHRFAIVEDDFDHEFAFEGRPVLPLAGADPGVVVYVGTFSKLLAPGLRLGWVAAPPQVIDALAAQALTTDRQGDRVLERAVAELLDDGLVARHARKVRRIYAARRDVLAEAVRERLPQVTFDLPPGGLSLWVRWPRGTDLAAAAARGPAAGVAFHPADRFAGGPGLAAARLGYSSLDERELREAVRRLAGLFRG